MLTFFSNFLQEKLKERIEIVPKEILPERFPETSIPESLGGTLKVDHLAWLNNCLLSYSETQTENSSWNGALKNSVGNVRHGNKDLIKDGSSTYAQDEGLSEGAFTMMEFMEHLMKLTRKGIQNEFVNLRRLAGVGNFLSTK